MLRIYTIGLAIITTGFASDTELVNAAETLFPDSKLTSKNQAPYNFTSLRYRTNQPFPKIEQIIEKALGLNWQKLEISVSNLELNSMLKASGIDVISTAQFGNKAEQKTSYFDS